MTSTKTIIFGGNVMKKGILRLISIVVLVSMLTMLTSFAATAPTISGQNSPPDTITLGQTFSIKGIISSSTNIKKVTVSIFNASGTQEIGMSAEPNTKSYDIAKLDPYIYFDKLTEGAKTYKVFAQNDSGVTTLVNKKFTVKSVGGVYYFPVPGYSYGSCQLNCTCSIHNGKHNGVDISAPRGSQIVAAHSGKVTIVSTCTEDYSKSDKCPCGKCGNQGNCIRIDGTNGVSTIYMHMSKITVSNGATVTAGQKVGTVGTTGWSTGSHLHFGLTVNGVYKNPPAYIK